MNADILKRALVIGFIGTFWAVTVISWATTKAAESSQSGQQPPGKTEPQQENNGKIGAIAQQERTVTVKGMLLEKTFDVPPNAEIVLKNKPNATFNDLKVGDEVKVSYHAEDEKLIARRIEVSEPKVGEIPASPTPLA
jgi:hypothetical protein